MIGALGLMPFLPQFPIVEVYPGVDCPAYAAKGRFQLHSSDAHRLDAMHGPEFTLPVEENTISGIFSVLEKLYKAN